MIYIMLKFRSSGVQTAWAFARHWWTTSLHWVGFGSSHLVGTWQCLGATSNKKRLLCSGAKKGPPKENTPRKEPWILSFESGRFWINLFDLMCFLKSRQICLWLCKMPLRQVFISPIWGRRIMTFHSRTMQPHSIQLFLGPRSNHIHTLVW